VLGLVEAEDEFDWNAAESEFRTALASNPRDPVTLGYAAIVAQARGEYQEAQRLIDTSLALDPLNPFSLQTLGNLFFVTADYTSAEPAFRKSIAISATFDGSHFYLGRMLLTRGQFEAALKEFQAEPAADAKDAGLAMVYHALGRKDDSNSALARLIAASGDTWPYSVSIVHAYSWRAERSFRMAGKGVRSAGRGPGRKRERRSGTRAVTCRPTLQGSAAQNESARVAAS
jgi:tetratricopeptide (TPR) repeat protein